jgi:molecular chaperone GrpE
VTDEAEPTQGRAELDDPTTKAQVSPSDGEDEAAVGAGAEGAPDGGGDAATETADAQTGASETGVPASDAAGSGDAADAGDGGDTPDTGDVRDTGDVDVDEALQAAADAVEVDLELLLSERAQYLDAYRRAQADFENYRKQAQKRQDDAIVRSLGRFVEGLLPVLDSCDAALAHGASEVEPVLTALYGALTKEGLERIEPKGAAFDPTEAEAVMHEPGEGGDQIVAEVLRPGYRWRGQVLRPAMVKVTD